MRAGQAARQVRGFVESRDVRREKCDLNALVSEAVRLAELVHRSRLAVRLELAEDPPTVFVDRTQVMQVVLDLLSNAADAVEDAHVTEPVVEVATARDGRFAVVTVRDNGAGIPLEHRQQVFDQFYTTKPHGMGVGLPISRAVVENYGGTLDLRPVPSGTQFRFTLPLERQTPSDATSDATTVPDVSRAV
jgi:signal transduction histidine kinase